MQRIAIIGSSGAGKSTLAVALGRALDLPVVHLDRLHWRPNWREVTREEFVAAQEAALPVDGAWIVDGNFGGTMALRIARADTIVHLDYPTYVCVWRALRRWQRYRGTVRPDMGDGCVERFDPEFIKYVARFRRDHRPKIFAKLAALGPAQRLVTLATPAAAARFLAALHA